MPRFRLSSEPSVTALVLDLLVLLFALSSAFAMELPVWVRLIFGVVALLAAVLAVRSARLLHRRSRLIGASARDGEISGDEMPGTPPHPDGTADTLGAEHRMTEVLAVWQGPMPANAEEAGETLDRLMDAEDKRARDAPARPVTPGIEAFLTDLLTRWPDPDRPDDKTSPWGASVREGASGELSYLCLMRGPQLDKVVEHIATLAGKHRLVCYDPQLEEVIS
ncbi:hypothetical protein [Nocardioides sp.]|uniref:hypothetical protein n=1 Tax=Nocardioides sp. TaxID=35761 RepID=UPI0027328193|nr:hypothetical protein [Nocardioides sp.]MDP3895024.1 hypothetical protein [Nocardioides sp.]